jgi:hypothetical protein
MEFLWMIVLGVVAWWVYKVGKRVGSSRGFHFGRIRGWRDRRRR